jgi:uncharacterized membrane protein YfcA
MEPLLLSGLAGVGAGIMNAIAGGGTFVALPVLIAIGLSSTVANQSCTVALFPGQITAGWSVRHLVRGLGDAGPGILLTVSVVGGLIGALLLMFTPPVVLDRLLPWLLLVATLAFAFGRDVGAALRARGIRMGLYPVLAVQFVLAVYGGYFGGGVGIMMMAIWMLLDNTDVKTMTPTRIILVTFTNATAVICFALAGDVSWPPTLAMAVGSAIGGVCGAKLTGRMSPRLVRAAVMAVAVTMTIVFFRRAYAS